MSADRSTATNESPNLDLKNSPIDNLRWALTALELAERGLKFRRHLGDDDTEMHNLRTGAACVEDALRLLRSESESTKSAKPVILSEWQQAMAAIRWFIEEEWPDDYDAWPEEHEAIIKIALADSRGNDA